MALFCGAKICNGNNGFEYSGSLQVWQRCVPFVSEALALLFNLGSITEKMAMHSQVPSIKNRWLGFY